MLEAVTDPPLEVVPPAVEPPVGAVWPLVVDDVLEVAGGLTTGGDDWPDVVGGFLVPVAEVVGVAFAALVGGVLAQPVEVPVGVAFGELLAVVLSVGVALAVPVGLLVGVPVPVGVLVGLLLSVGVTWGVLVALDGLAGGLLLAVLVGDGLTLGEASGDALGAGDDEHDGAGAAVESAADKPLPSGLALDDPFAGAAPGFCGLDELLVPLKADTTMLPSPLRSGGTAASTTPTANTVTPMASAGRSMTSFQFLGRCGACRAEPARAGAAGRNNPASCAKNPEMASRIAAIRDWLA